MNLGENIYRLRTERNLSQGDFADALEVSRQSVSKWENNSAVPELEKLVKMAELFGITLDELVSGERKESASAPPPPQSPAAPEPAEKIVYVEKVAPASISAWTILGAVLLLGALGVALILSNDEYKFSLLEVFLIALPVAVCGIICMVAKHPPLWCSWVVSGGYWVYFFILSNHWEENFLLLFFGILLVMGTVVYTVMLHRCGKVHVPAWVWGAMTLALAATALLLFLNLLPPLGVDVIEKPVPMN